MLFDEQSWESLADAVMRFEPARYSSAVIRKHAEQFSAAHFRDRIKAVIEREAQRLLERRSHVHQVSDALREGRAVIAPASGTVAESKKKSQG